MSIKQKRVLHITFSHNQNVLWIVQSQYIKKEHTPINIFIQIKISVEDDHITVDENLRFTHATENGKLLECLARSTVFYQPHEEYFNVDLWPRNED